MTLSVAFVTLVSVMATSVASVAAAHAPEAANAIAARVSAPLIFSTSSSDIFAAVSGSLVRYYLRL